MRAQLMSSVFSTFCNLSPPFILILRLQVNAKNSPTLGLFKIEWLVLILLVNKRPFNEFNSQRNYISVGRLMLLIAYSCAAQSCDQNL